MEPVQEIQPIKQQPQLVPQQVPIHEFHPLKQNDKSLELPLGGNLNKINQSIGLKSEKKVQQPMI